MINNIINIVKSHLLQYNCIEIDLEIQDNILLIDLHPRFKFIQFNTEIIDLIKLIEAELEEKQENKYRISVYNKFDYKEEKQQHDKDVKVYEEAIKVCNMLNKKKEQMDTDFITEKEYETFIVAHDATITNNKIKYNNNRWEI